MLNNQLFGMVISLMFVCGTSESSWTGAISQNWMPHGTLRCSCFQQMQYMLLPPFVYLFVKFWEVTTSDLTCIHESDNPSVGLSSEEEKRRARVGEYYGRQSAKYRACQFVVTQAVTKLLGHCLAGAVILRPCTFWETSGFR